ncbi:MAG TPA: hypothetical protein VK797_23360 [Tepidisphaeraceae bacterium]|jgi:hypothetical protein|nr:hypothetical protein [Tepidisphaeraceae bacterium]
MRLAFYKITAPKATALDRAVNFFSGRGGYAHVELVFSGPRTGGAGDAGGFESFSSSARDGGTRFKTIDVDDAASWGLIDIGGSVAQEILVRDFCTAQQGKPYDYLGIVGFIIPVRDFDHPGRRWFCSEICIAALEAGGLLLGPPRPIPEKESPNSLKMLA